MMIQALLSLSNESRLRHVSIGAMLKALQYAISFCCLAAAVSQATWGQAVRIVLQAPKPEVSVSSLSLTASPASVNFRLVSGGIASGSSAVQVTTTWGGSLCLLTCTINVYAYFANASSALSSAAPVTSIPSSEVLGRVTTGTPTTYTPFTQANPFGGGGAGLLLYQQGFFILTGGGSRTDALNLEIDLSNQPHLPADTYTGILYIQAQSL
jgi:hypothetical protein